MTEPSVFCAHMAWLQGNLGDGGDVASVLCWHSHVMQVRVLYSCDCV